VYEVLDGGAQRKFPDGGAFGENQGFGVRVIEQIAPDSYGRFLADLRGRIRAAQLRASLAVSRELVLLYWQMGREILDRQGREKWGSEGHRPSGGRFEKSLPRNEGVFPAEFEVHAGI
jgi:hypothetical protein